MSSTKALQFTAKSAFCETQTGSLILIFVKEPNVYDILNGISDDEIRGWARGFKAPNDLFEAEAVVKWAKDEYKPEEIFSKDELEEWAIANGFVKEAP